MARTLGSYLIAFALITSPLTVSAATTTSHGTHRHLTNIVFSGLAGAIMGLSTLSFYGRPQDRLNNIGVGFALGIIGGTIYTTYRAAAEPRDFYSFRGHGEMNRSEPWSPAETPRFARADAVTFAAYAFSF